jgi:hypothetical protein
MVGPRAAERLAVTGPLLSPRLRLVHKKFFMASKDARERQNKAQLLDLVFGEFYGRVFAGLHVALVEFRILLPLLGKIVQRKNR